MLEEEKAEMSGHDVAHAAIPVHQHDPHAGADALASSTSSPQADRDPHAGHDKHAGHDPEMFRRRFWLSLP